MAYTDEQLQRIYDRTSGYCHICHKKLSFVNYAQYGARSAWEVDHSKAKARGGTNHGNNLYPACISCNRSKRAGSSRAARTRNGQCRAPYSRAKVRAKRNDNQLGGVITGGIIGSRFGPGGAVVGALLGAWFGDKNTPKK
ncbi:MAG: HNH endonuclease [Acidobacteria bacterium]|nr:HNH endonuclease [Acidobacteriota bacterium]